MEKGKFPALVEAFNKHSKVPPNYWTCPKCGEVWLGSWGVEQDGSTNPTGILAHRNSEWEHFQPSVLRVSFR